MVFPAVRCSQYIFSSSTQNNSCTVEPESATHFTCELFLQNNTPIAVIKGMNNSMDKSNMFVVKQYG